ncbi:hypothetical protein [Halomontanus rarus]|uniref:hypothetical protein n=1 Tax=Halomontanus rarus TaxID=3034020 RepID=UPI001A990868
MENTVFDPKRSVLAVANGPDSSAGSRRSNGLTTQYDVSSVAGSSTLELDRDCPNHDPADGR